MRCFPLTPEEVLTGINQEFGRRMLPPHARGGACLMTFHSILFKKTEDSLKKETVEAPVFFVDLNLDQIIDAVTAGRDQYNLKPLFFTSLNDIGTIKYRQEIAQDLENGTLLENIRSFAQKMIVMRRYLAMIEKLYYKYNKEGWFLEAVIIYCDAVKGLANDLSQVEINYPAASSGVLEQRQLTVFMQLLVFAALLSDVVAYRVLVSMFADGGRKITVCPKLAAPQNPLYLRAALEHLSCGEAL